MSVLVAAWQAGRDQQTPTGPVTGGGGPGVEIHSGAYVVHTGDTLLHIAEMHGTSVQAIL